MTYKTPMDLARSILRLSIIGAASVVILSCQTMKEGHRMSTNNKPGSEQIDAVKPVVYQVFTRLFGNTNTTNTPWGTIEQNGVGKFSDFTVQALAGIKQLGVTHIWYTGVPHHAVINDYTEYGISLDDPDVVKGRAGSPYAVKDYYSVNPDLADDPARRVEEFSELIQRTHNMGMKVIIDIVPNHVARKYESKAKPDGISDFGVNDDTSVAYARDNNFYYVVGEPFRVPNGQDDYQPLGGQTHPLADGEFSEVPAKWTGNGSRLPQPDANDWYETVKINYGVTPDGRTDFPQLPADFRDKDFQQHARFWQGKDVPDSWKKFAHIVHYWLDKGVDGFRYDMAEMVPVEFWSYLNSSIKSKNPDAFLLAEVYDPRRYRDYIQLGKMDYLYDKVEFYDSLKKVMQQHGSMDEIELIAKRMADIEPHMLHFLENHDEQRIASPEFAGDAQWGKPALVVSALINTAPFMLYFGQEVGEDGSEQAGFGQPSRTSIFDYIGVPAHQRWMNQGKFDGGQLSQSEQLLREYYQDVLNIAISEPAIGGQYISLHSANRWAQSGYDQQLFSFVRHAADSSLIVVSSFHPQRTAKFDLVIPQEALEQLGLTERRYVITDLLSDKSNTLTIDQDQGRIALSLKPLESVVLKISHK